MRIMINLNSMQSGKHIVDAKSILGIFSLDLSHDLTFTIDGNVSLVECKKVMTAISQFEA